MNHFLKQSIFISLTPHVLCCYMVSSIYQKMEISSFDYDKRKRVRTDETIKTDNKLIETYA